MNCILNENRASQNISQTGKSSLDSLCRLIIRWAGFSSPKARCVQCRWLHLSYSSKTLFTLNREKAGTPEWDSSDLLYLFTSRLDDSFLRSTHVFLMPIQQTWLFILIQISEQLHDRCLTLGDYHSLYLKWEGLSTLILTETLPTKFTFSYHRLLVKFSDRWQQCALRQKNWANPYSASPSAFKVVSMCVQQGNYHPWRQTDNATMSPSRLQGPNTFPRATGPLKREQCKTVWSQNDGAD